MDKKAPFIVFIFLIVISSSSAILDEEEVEQEPRIIIGGIEPGNLTIWEDIYQNTDISKMDEEPQPYNYTYAPDNSFGISYTSKEVNTTYFWDFFDDVTEYKCAYFQKPGWVECTENISVSHSIDVVNITDKITISIVDAPVTSKYRMTYGINMNATGYINTSGEFPTEIRMNYSIPNTNETYQVFWNWSDIQSEVDVGNLSLLWGLKDIEGGQWFWFTITTIGFTIMQGETYELDPEFGYSGSISGVLSIEDYITGQDCSDFNGEDSPGPSSDGIAQYINVSLDGWDNGEKVQCAIYSYTDWCVDSALVGVTEENSGGGDGWCKFEFSDPKPNVYSTLNYSLVVWSDSDVNIDFGFDFGTRGIFDASKTYAPYENGFPEDIDDADYNNMLWAIFCNYTEIEENEAPTVDPYYPTNGSGDIPLFPLCKAWVNDTDTATLDVTWATNASGEWVNVHTNSSWTANTLCNYTFTEFNEVDTDYWWKVYVNDTETNVSEIYHFNTSEGPGWWNEDWGCYKTITISNPMEGYQTLINVSKTSGGDVDCEGHCNDDFSDLRFVYANSTELPYWIEYNSSGDHALVWVNNLGNYSKIQMYYGNSSATTTSDGSITWDWFELWDSDHTGSYTKLNRGGSYGADNGYFSDNEYEVGTAYRQLVKWKIITYQEDTYGGQGRHGLAGDENSWSPDNWAVVMISSDTGHNADSDSCGMQFAVSKDDTGTGSGYAAVDFDMDTYYVNEIRMSSGSYARADMYNEDNRDSTHWSESLTTNVPINLDRNFFGEYCAQTTKEVTYWNYDGTNDVIEYGAGKVTNGYIELTTPWICIGKYNASGVSPPSLSFGDEVSIWDTTAPTIIINFVGNFSDAGGPYCRPPNESPQLTGVFSDGYYTNDSRQSEEYMYINLSVNGTEIDPDTVTLHWYNQSSGWTNDSYHFAKGGTTGEDNEYYYTFNSSGSFTVGPGHNYSFDIWANDTAGNVKLVWWNKTGMGGGYTRRYVQLGCSPVNISYMPFYLSNRTDASWAWTGSGDQNKYDRLHHDQGTDGTASDYGTLTNITPDSTVHNIHCSALTGHWFDDSTCIEPFTLDNIYYHVWWSTDEEHLSKLGWNKNRYYMASSTINDYNATLEGSRSNIFYDGATANDIYHLTTNLLDVDNTEFTDNDIYELAIKTFITGGNPSIVNNRSFTSFVLFNIPDNETLGSDDTDDDGLTDIEELYTTYTNPFIGDTDNDGIDDEEEYLVGTDPNNCSDTPTYVPYAYISPDGNDDTGDGSIGSPWATLQYAHDHTTYDNATIHMMDGTFTDIVNISKHIYITGNGTDKTFLTVQTDDDDWTINISSDYVEISNITAYGYGGLTFYKIIWIDGKSHVTIHNCSFNHSRPLVHIDKASDNCTIKDCTFYDAGYGVFVNSGIYDYTRDHRITNNIFYRLYSGVTLDNARYCRVDNNTFFECDNGVDLDDPSDTPLSNTIEWNTFNNSAYDIFESDRYIDGADEDWTNYQHNNTMDLIGNSSICEIVVTSHEGSLQTINEKVNFTITVTNLNGEATTDYTINQLVTYPSETVNYEEANGVITGNFTPTMNGLYSIVFNITDGNNSRLRDSEPIFVGSSFSSSETDYTLNTNVWSNKGAPGYKSDTGTLSTTGFIPPSGEEGYMYMSCSDFIEVYPYEVPRTTPFMFSSCEFSHWYNNSGDSAYITLERYGTFAATSNLGTWDLQEDIDPTDEEWEHDVTTFTNINWTYGRPNQFYRTEFQQEGEGGGGMGPVPKWLSTDQDKVPKVSYINMTTSYLTTPELVTNSNYNTTHILSATQESDTDVEIVIEGTGQTTLVVQMANTSVTYYVYFDDVQANTSGCNFVQDEGEINLELELDGIHTIDIRAPTISFTIEPTAYPFGFMTCMEEKTTTGNYFNITNTGEAPINIYICGSNATNESCEDDWVLSTSTGENQYRLLYSTDGGSSWKNITLNAGDPEGTLATALQPEASQLFDLKIITPSATTCYEQMKLAFELSAVQS